VEVMDKALNGIGTVIAGLPLVSVLVGTTDQQVVTEATDQQVVTGTAIQGIRSSQTRQGVIARQTIERVITGRTLYGISQGSTVEHIAGFDGDMQIHARSGIVVGILHYHLEVEVRVDRGGLGLDKADIG